MQVFILSRREELIFLAAKYLDLNYAQKTRLFERYSLAQKTRCGSTADRGDVPELLAHIRYGWDMTLLKVIFNYVKNKNEQFFLRNCTGF
jgi:hypothetical protein